MNWNVVSQQEIVSLYQRFCQLDRNSGGFISADEFLSVPEFAVNPLSQRLFRMIDGLNFKEFVAFLSAFSSRATLQHKVECNYPFSYLLLFLFYVDLFDNRFYLQLFLRFMILMAMGKLHSLIC